MLSIANSTGRCVFKILTTELIPVGAAFWVHLFGIVREWFWLKRSKLFKKSQSLTLNWEKIEKEICSHDFLGVACFHSLQEQSTRPEVVFVEGWEGRAGNMHTVSNIKGQEVCWNVNIPPPCPPHRPLPFLSYLQPTHYHSFLWFLHCETQKCVCVCVIDWLLNL
jgi:hypothetical protein